MVRLRRILCPVDFFPASVRAADYALKLAANHGGTVLALHVLAPIIAAAYGDPINVAPVMADLERQARRSLKALQLKARKLNIPFEFEIRHGDVSREIQSAINDSQADAVVMGTHGRRGFERWIMGSVTERLIRQCPVPLFTVGSSGKMRGSPLSVPRILLTTDFSAGTSDAVQYAFSIARECQAKITFLHVVHDLSAAIGGKLTDRLILGVRRKLDEVIIAGGADPTAFRTVVEAGQPYRTILAAVRQYKPGLVVMNIHGKSGAERALVGSTAERVVRGVVNVCPVLLIPPLRPVRRKNANRKGRLVA
jgi:nucleotide-binding universal stress UspA family protein